MKELKKEIESEVEPARIRPELYEYFLREPDKAATLITADGAISV